MSWRDRAACVGMDPAVFFPGRGEPADTAREVCGSCPVAAECLAAAEANVEKHGIWGGLSERQRRATRTAAGRPCARCGERTETKCTYCGPCGIIADLEARRRAQWARDGRSCPRCGEVLHGGENAVGGLCGRWECDRAERRARDAVLLDEAS